jgi:hypothetical protein
MDSIDTLRQAILSVIAEWEQLPRIPSDWKIISVQDTIHDRYTIQNVSFANDRYDTTLLAYMEIRERKIWILTDNTEEGIANELVAKCVPRDHIVLGFYSPELREVGEFAVA